MRAKEKRQKDRRRRNPGRRSFLAGPGLFSFILSGFWFGAGLDGAGRITIRIIIKVKRTNLPERKGQAAMRVR